jgi:hypothetical protein
MPIGPKQFHPDFVIFNPRRGVLVLGVKAGRSTPFSGWIAVMPGC